MDMTGVAWRKASYSGGENTHCVEVAAIADKTAIRDSKAPDAGNILLSCEDFRRFANAVKGL
ncbi:DUF397 domain-containing protein [Spirillospora sp. NPDC127200]